MENNYEAEIKVNDIKNIGTIKIGNDKLTLRVNDQEKMIPFSTISNAILTLENTVQITLTNGAIVMISIYNNEILLNAINNNTHANINNKDNQRNKKNNLLKILVIAIIIIAVYSILKQSLGYSKDTNSDIGSDTTSGNLYSCSDMSYFITKAQSDLYYRFSTYSNVRVDSCKVRRSGKRITVFCRVSKEWVDNAGPVSKTTEEVTYSCS